MGPICCSCFLCSKATGQLFEATNRERLSLYQHQNCISCTECNCHVAIHLLYCLSQIFAPAESLKGHSCLLLESKEWYVTQKEWIETHRSVISSLKQLTTSIPVLSHSCDAVGRAKRAWERKPRAKPVSTNSDWLPSLVAVAETSIDSSYCDPKMDCWMIVSRGF